MVKVIMGLQGFGKTKQLIELVNQAITSESGNIVCIERGSKLTYDIHHDARLVDISKYPITNFVQLKAFISGMYAGNYDISEIFIDSLFRVVNSDSIPDTEEFLEWVFNFGKENNITFTITISADVAKATDKIKKYF